MTARPLATLGVGLPWFSMGPGSLPCPAPGKVAIARLGNVSTSAAIVTVHVGNLPGCCLPSDPCPPCESRWSGTATWRQGRQPAQGRGLVQDQLCLLLLCGLGQIPLNLSEHQIPYLQSVNNSSVFYLAGSWYNEYEGVLKLARTV